MKVLSYKKASPPQKQVPEKTKAGIKLSEKRIRNRKAKKERLTLKAVEEQQEHENAKVLAEAMKNSIKVQKDGGEGDSQGS